MRFNLTYIFLYTVALFGCVFVESSEMAEPTPTVAAEPTLTKLRKHDPWKLAWQDEFNDDHIGENWVADVNDWGGGNDELQYYTDRSENVYIENGLLYIVGRKESYLTREYTSARITSTESWTYGRFEIKAQLPEGQGIWPAIWLRSDTEPYGSWPASGEIDIMEMLGHEPTVVYGTLHYGLPDEQKQGSTILPSQGFHVFAVEWDVDEIRWYVDDINYLKIDSWYSNNGNYPAPFDQPFNIVLNLAIGGIWPGNPNESTSFPQKLLIDYVRVYQK
jgi:beta-glucanase (GH16 family)